MSTRKLPGGKGRSVLKADNLTAIYKPTVLLEPQPLTTLWVSTTCYRDSLERKADNLTAIYEPIVLWEPQPLTTLWAFTACYRDSFTLLLTNI
jgi:hypothetical protein